MPDEFITADVINTESILQKSIPWKIKTPKIHPYENKGASGCILRICQTPAKKGTKRSPAVPNARQEFVWNAGDKGRAQHNLPRAVMLHGAGISNL